MKKIPGSMTDSRDSLEWRDGRISRRRWMGGASAAAVASVISGRGEGAPDGRDTELEQACRRNLKLIFDGVSRYVGEGREHPYRLSDLAGTYIDHDVLICPSLVSSGRLHNPRPELISNIAQDPLTFYAWEYGGNTLGSSGWTNRKFKDRQRQTAVGDWVPMVRCHAHRRPNRILHLNLSFGGAVYESGLYWETLFRHLCPMPYLANTGMFFSETHPPLYTADIPQRAARAARGALDLGAAYNALLPDPWYSDEPADQLDDWVARLGPEWLFDHEGVQFDARGVVQVEGDAVRLNRDREPDRQLGYYPRSARPIRVNQPVSRLHALAGVIHGSEEGSEVGRIRLFHRDTEVESLALLQGRHVHHQPSGQEAMAAESKLVHRRPPVEGATDDAPHAIYHVSWPLPTDGRVIDRLEFSATEGPASPFLMAVTVEA